MNILLTIGLLLLTGYSAGFLLNKIGLPKIVGYIATGILFSPNTTSFIHPDIIESTEPLMDVCLAFITFVVGGALKWSKIKLHEKEIISITVLASIFPFIFVSSAVYAFGLLFPSWLPFNHLDLLFFALLLGSLSSPTAPAATIAVIHQYRAKGKVTDTIMGVAALDDVLGILLFSLTIGFISIFNGGNGTQVEIFNSFYQIIVALIIGTVIAFSTIYIANILKLSTEGQWIVVISAFIVLCAGISVWLKADDLLSCMTMGVVVVNKCKKERLIFRILERYTEDLIFLFFFLLSGLYLDITSIPHSIVLIFLFVMLRTVGKFMGANTGARIVKADKSIQKYTAGGLLPQAGIVIGLVLSIYPREELKEIATILLTTIMGATIIHELIGPIAAKYALMKAKEIKTNGHDSK